MSEKPILFNTEMVRAILGDRKSQTRRVMNPQPAYVCGHDNEEVWHPDEKREIKCPYGKHGDLLWVRETFTIHNIGVVGAKGELSWGAMHAVYEADGEESKITNYPFNVCMHDKRKYPSIHMPKELARIWLRVLDVRVERVQDITNSGAMAEGIYEWYKATVLNDFDGYNYWSPVNGSGAASKFSELWNSINEKRGYGWEVNPWVWVIEFEVPM